MYTTSPNTTPSTHTIKPNVSSVPPPMDSLKNFAEFRFGITKFDSPPCSATGATSLGTTIVTPPDGRVAADWARAGTHAQATNPIVNTSAHNVRFRIMHLQIAPFSCLT